MRIAFVYTKGRPPGFIGKSYELADHGGSEGSMVQYAFALANMGHKVCIYVFGAESHSYRGVEWRDVSTGERFEQEFDAVIAMRFPDALLGMNAPVKALFCHDPEVPSIPGFIRSGGLNLIIVVSNHHKARFQRQHPIDEKLYLISNSGLVWSEYDRIDVQKVRGRCIYCSVPERGLGSLLSIWPLIYEKLPWATLHVTGSLEIWGIDFPIEKSNHFHSAQGLPGIKFTGFIPREDLIKEQLQSQVLLLPGNPGSPEMCCMSAMECAAARNALIVTDLCALSERVIPEKTGCIVHRKGAWQKEFADMAVQLLTYSDLYKMQLQAQAEEKAHDYKVLARQWTTRLEVELRAR